MYPRQQAHQVQPIAGHNGDRSTAFGLPHANYLDRTNDVRHRDHKLELALARSRSSVDRVIPYELRFQASIRPFRNSQSLINLWRGHEIAVQHARAISLDCTSRRDSTTFRSVPTATIRQNFPTCAVKCLYNLASLPVNPTFQSRQKERQGG